MPTASEVTLRALQWAITDAPTIARYQQKILTIPGWTCAIWTGAITSKGHGRFWIRANEDDRDIVVIAHRFGWALAYGMQSLAATKVLGHGCDNPLCQLIDPQHVEASTAAQNRREWANRRHTLGSPLRDRRGAMRRALAVREAARGGLDPTDIAAAGLVLDSQQPPLF